MKSTKRKVATKNYPVLDAKERMKKRMRRSWVKDSNGPPHNFKWKWWVATGKSWKIFTVFQTLTRIQKNQKLFLISFLLCISLGIWSSNSSHNYNPLCIHYIVFVIRRFFYSALIPGSRFAFLLDMFLLLLNSSD